MSMQSSSAVPHNSCESKVLTAWQLAVVDIEVGGSVMG